MNASLKFLALLLVSGPTIASTFGGYECEIAAARSLSENGVLEEGGYLSLFIGKTFTVDRDTGRMIGVLINHNGVFGQPKVIEPGSKDNSFIALTIYEPNSMVDLLVIKELAEGKEKPFFFATRSDFATGICVAY